MNDDERPSDAIERPYVSMRRNPRLQTDEFKRWFGQSKIVDANGEPLVVYHGTASPSFTNDGERAFFSSRNGAGEGAYFTADPEIAAEYASMDSEVGDGYAAILPVYLSIQNYKVMDAYAIQSITPAQRDALESQGFDGVVTEGFHQIVAFRPEQIKSATGNQGEFDPDNPDITHSARRFYHGTAFRGIEKFSTEKIGNGEGAQAYGWGLYFASRLAVAEYYRNALSKTTPAHNTIDGKRITKGMLAQLRQDPDPSVSDFFRSHAGARATGVTNIADAVDTAVAEARRQREVYQARLVKHLAQPPIASTYGPADYERFIALVDRQIDGLCRLKSRLGFNKAKRGGQVYEVDIPDDDQMLLWDRPLSEQPMNVRDAICALHEKLHTEYWETHASFAQVYARAPLWRESDHTGASLYQRLSHYFNSDAEASQALAAYDIKGIKYLDGVSRGRGEGSHNYVVFSGEDVAIHRTLYSLQAPLGGFFSALARGIDGMPTKLASAESWKAQIKGLVNKGHAKQDEIEWSGLEDWMDLQVGKISKGQVLDFLANDGVKVEEVVLGADGLDGVGQMYVDHASDWGDEWGVFSEEGVIIGGTYPSQQDAEKAMESMALSKPSEYGRFTLPGGENYREVLIALPDKADSTAKPPTREQFSLFDEAGNLVSQGLWPPIASVQARLDAKLAANPAWRVEVQSVLNEQADRLMAQAAGNYKSSHWSTPNVVAHLRLDDRTDADGNRVLFVNEIQSDWGKDGKKKGFASGREVRPEDVPLTAQDPVFGPSVTVETRLRQAENARAELPALRDLARQAVENFYGGKVAGNSKAEAVVADEARWLQAANLLGDGKTEKPVTVYFDKQREVAFREREANQIRQHYVDESKRMRSMMVPTAPFVTKTECWLNLALKRVISMAADGGYDKVAFISGQQAADLYDLSKTIESIGYDPKTGRLEAFDKKRSRVLNESGIEPEMLDDYIGKVAAKRLLATKLTMGKHLLEGEDIKTGGEGLRTFYDQIVPIAMGKLLKKVGGGQVRKVMFDPADIGENPDDYTVSGAPQIGFDVTPEMRNLVAGQGLPLFSLRCDEQTQTDAFKRWFGGSRVVDAQGKPLVVYHGTHSSFQAFQPSKLGELGSGIYFGSHESANDYGASEDGHCIIPVYLSLQNPLKINAGYLRGEEKYDIESPASLLVEHLFGDERAAEIFDQLRNSGDNKLGVEIQRAAEALGHDGLIIDWGDHDGRPNLWHVAFYPNQVKSALGNCGQFQADDDRILFSESERDAEIVDESLAHAAWMRERC